MGTLASIPSAFCQKEVFQAWMCSVLGSQCHALGQHQLYTVLCAWCKHPNHHESQPACGILLPAGESVLYAAARYCCTTGSAFALQELTKAGADWTQPNRHGVSPVLLLKRHTASGRPLPRAVEDGLLNGCWKQEWTRLVGRVLGASGVP